MPKIYEVSNNPKLYIDAGCNSEESSKYISYRMVICHAIHYLINSVKKEKEEIRSLLSDLCDLKNKEMDSEYFFEVRHLRNTKDILVIDNTGGCYPLVLRADNRGADRIVAFHRSSIDIKDKFDQIYDILKDANFLEVTHCKLEHYFKFKNN